MLGKGLESLIPPSAGGQPASNDPGRQAFPAEPAAPAQAPQQPQSQTEGQKPLSSPPASPAAASPVLPGAARAEEPLLSPPEELPILPDEPRPATLPTEAHAREEKDMRVPLTTIGLEVAPEPQGAADASAARERDPKAVGDQYGARPQKGRSDAIFYLEVDLIHPNPNQPRRHFDQDAIDDLAASIREFGILQPLTVRKIEQEVPNGTVVEYELIAGERRLLAAKRAGLERVPAIIRTVDIARERLELAVIENIQRENLSSIEMARAFARLQDEFRLTQREIAARLGKSREVVANTLRLLDLPGYIQEALEKNQVSESHGRLLLGIEDPAAQQALFHDLLNQHLTTRELRRRAAFLKGKKDPVQEPASQQVAPELKHFEARLASELGAPVSIKPQGGGGKIMIEFYSPEELAEIVRRFGEEI